MLNVCSGIYTEISEKKFVARLSIASFSGSEFDNASVCNFFPFLLTE